MKLLDTMFLHLLCFNVYGPLPEIPNTCALLNQENKQKNKKQATFVLKSLIYYFIHYLRRQTKTMQIKSGVK